MANVLLTRAAFRDEVRRCLAIIPPVDVPGGGAVPGEQPTNAPKPTNQEINQALQNAVSDSNRSTGFHVNRFSVPVPAQVNGEFGPFRIDLSNLSPNTYGVIESPLARINDVRRVLWFSNLAKGNQPAEGGVLLSPVNRDNLDRSGTSQYYGIPAASPQQWYVEEYSLWITPAQQVYGTYLITCGTGITGLQCDTDTLDQVPIDYQSIIVYGAVYHLSIAETQDVEWKDRAGSYGSMFAQGIKQFKEFIVGGTGAPQPIMAFKSYRGGYGTRRVVR